MKSTTNLAYTWTVSINGMVQTSLTSGIVTVGYASEFLITVTSRLLTLLAPRKLLSVTEIVYTPSTGKSALGTEVGDEKLNPELRTVATAEPSPCTLVTVNTGASQARPPEPDDESRSRDQGE